MGDDEAAAAVGGEKIEIEICPIPYPCDEIPLPNGDEALGQIRGAAIWRPDAQLGQAVTANGMEAKLGDIVLAEQAGASELVGGHVEPADN